MPSGVSLTSMSYLAQQTSLTQTAEPSEAGLDPARLEVLNRHFATYVDDGRLPGFLVAISRGGKVAHLHCYGRRDVEKDLPVTTDTVFRWASMTKPLTSVAALMLLEEGALELKDPISRWLPEFERPEVYVAGGPARPELRPAAEPIRVWHLLTHTSGLTYGFQHAHPVDAMYRQAGFEWTNPPGVDLAQATRMWARLPLLFDPGSEWNYGVSTDVLGRLVEVVSGQDLAAFISRRILEPLGMSHTGFAVAPEDFERLAVGYAADPSGRRPGFSALPQPEPGRAPSLVSGGGGLLGTAGDYLRFSEMLRCGGSLEGERLLGRQTVSYMTSNHLPGGADLESFGRPLFSETAFGGVGFGLGVSVLVDPVANKVLGTRGEYGWGGAFSTSWWVAPAEELSVLFFTQLLPSSTYPLRSELKNLVYQALA